jgi:FlaA1/EpsC-like NDP-sugar epimerase
MRAVPELDKVPPLKPLAVPLEKIPWVRRLGKLALDLGLAGLAWSLAAGVDPGQGWEGAPLFLGLALAANLAFALTRQHYRLLDLREAKAILFASLALAAGASGAGLARDPGRALVFLGASLLGGALWFLARILVGAAEDRRNRRGSTDRERTLIVGAGRAGLRLCQEILEHPRVDLQIVGFVDDAPEKQGVRIQGLPVLGDTRHLGDLVRTQRVSRVILGRAGCSGTRIHELSREIRTLGVQVQMVPGIRERVQEVRRQDVAAEELLRRDPVRLDVAAIRRALAGTTALITGAGGSIGSELARRVAAFGPKRLVLLGRGENSLWEIERDLRRRHPALDLEVALCDVRDARRLAQVFGEVRPRAVFHAAAHKHVPYLERHPEEAVLNNVLGTRNVLDAALEAGTGILVNVSTDKAVNPVNALGASKRIGEHLVTLAAAHAPKGSRYVSVRFGNVLGSRGSVIPIFRDQIARGGPITVTHPDMVRYFMTIPEAVQLTLQAGVLGETARVFVLDMGAPVRILDLAHDLARLSGYQAGIDLDIQITGPRPGEKLFEELFSGKEIRKAGIHPKVFEAAPDALDPALLERGLAGLEEALDLPDGRRQRQILAWFRNLVPAYEPSPDGLGRYLAAPEPASPGRVAP